jgi:cytoskeleton-associated protein 5
MVDPNLQQSEEGPFVQRALNLLMLKLLDHSDKTTSLSVLLQYLDSCIPAQLSTNSKVAELLMKCLLKQTKVLSSVIKEVKVDFLLKDIHNFLEHHPPTKWKGHDDMPLRTIKTILNEIVTIVGRSIYSHLTLIPTTVSPPPAIISYINVMLKAGEAPAALPIQSASAQMPGVQQSASDLKLALSAIFQRIGNKETTHQGLVELSHFKKEHPEVDITPHLGGTSQHFQAYIERGLQQIDKQPQSENQGQ